MDITEKEMQTIREYTDAQLAEYHDLVRRRWEKASRIMAPRWEQRRKYASDEAKRRFGGVV